MAVVLARLGAYLLVAWLGIWVHELHRLPRSFGLTWEGSLLLLGVALLVYALSSLSGRRRALLIFPLAYGLMGFLSAAVTVLPLPFLPFVPEQTLEHYAVHLVWATLQVPLIIGAYRRLRGS